MADGNEPVLKAGGLYTSPNPLSYVPSGSLKFAKNTVSNFPGVVESRRGFKYLPYSFGTSDSRGKALMSYLGTLLVQYDAQKLAYDSGVAFVDYAGNYGPSSRAIRTRSVEANLDLYFTSAAGTYVIDDATQEPKLSGLPRGPMATINGGGTRIFGDPGSGWMPGDSQVGYLVVVGIRDAQGAVKLGEASPTLYIANPSDKVIPGGTNDLSAIVAPPNSAVIQDISGSNFLGALNAYVSDPDESVPFRISISFPLDTPSDPYFGTGGLATIIAYHPLTAAREIAFTFDNAVLGAGGPGATYDATVTTAFKDISVAVDVPSYLTTDHFLRVYRTKSSTGVTVQPNADYYLVNEIPVTSAMLTAGFYRFTDSVPDEALLNPYYNNVNVGGESPDGSPDNENARPPKCDDLANWDDRLWGAACQEPSTLQVTLLGVSGGAIYGDTSAGLQIGDTVTTGGVTYTAITPGATGAGQFEVYTIGLRPMLTQAECVVRTMISLCLAINNNPLSSVTAYPAPYNPYSDNQFLPGAITLQGKDPSAPTFTFSTSRPSAWSPDPTAGLTSVGEDAQNTVWFSKQEQPEAVPKLNRLTVGPRNNRIVRIKALGERLFCFCTRGIYTVSNKFPYRVDLLTKTATIIGPDTLSDFDDALYLLTTQGFVKVSNSGPAVLSIPIEADIKRMFGTGLSTLNELSVSVGYESYRKYIVSMPTKPSDTVNNQQFVYDVATKTWHPWDRPIAAMCLVPENDFLYTLSTTSNRVSVERKSYDRTDYADEEFSVTLSAVSADGHTLTLSSVTGITAGDAIYQTPDVWALVDSVDAGNSQVTMDAKVLWTVGGATSCYPGIDNAATFSELFGGKANYLKHFPAVTYHFRTTGITRGEAVFASERGPSEQPVAIPLPGWGLETFGTFAWENPPGPRNQRVTTTDNATRASFLSVGFQVREAFGVWSLLGITPEETVMSVRNSQ